MPLHFKKGRGALSNQTGRFEQLAKVEFDDGWDCHEEPATQIQTQLFVDTAKSVITYNQSPDVGFDRSINPYRGCEHGCVYCFARPSMLIWACRRAWILRPSCSTSPLRRIC